MLTAAGLLGLLINTASARDAEIAVVGAHIAGSTDEAARETAAALYEALKGIRGVEPLEAGVVVGRLSGRESLVVEGVFLGAGRDKLEEGRVLYERAEFESAIQVLVEAVPALEGGLAGAAESKDLVEALLMLGLSQAALGEEDKARAVFAQVMVLEPERELDRVNYPPKIVTMFTEVREATLSRPRAKLNITGDATEVWVDGRSYGKAPVTINDVVPGTHYVLAQGEGGRRDFTVIDLAEGESGRFQATLADRIIIQAAEDVSGRRDQTELLYRSLGEHVDVDLVLLAGELGSGEVGLQLYEPRTGNFSEIVTRPNGADPVRSLATAASLLAPYISDAGTLKADLVSSQVASLDINANPLLASMLLDPDPIVETIVERKTPWYVWAGAGTLAVGGAAGTALYLGSRGEDPTGTIVVTIPDL
ncbi:MAG: hypothetical protein ACI8RZ_000676 [Myxococcota bacterium]|jgi:hypothetical protein